jgi:opine dehydrogenase
MNEKRNKPTFAVLGAGCGGQAIAGYLACIGYDVALYNRSPARIASFQDQRRIRLQGEIEGIGDLSCVGTDLARAMAGRDVIMIVTTATGHGPLAREMASHLQDGQMILLNPGRTFGALEVSQIIRESGCSADVIVGEANTLVYVARVAVPGTVVINAVKDKVSVSAVRACNTPHLLDRLHDVYPQFVPAASFVETSLGNIGARLHPAILLHNRDRVLAKTAFGFYTDGITPRTARILEKVDSEFQTLAAALGSRFASIPQWLGTRYGIKQTDLRSMLCSNPSYQNVIAPTTLDHRYLWEDIPTGLVPISDVAQALDIGTPTIDSLIDQGSEELGRDFRKEGRTLKKLGLGVHHVGAKLSEMFSGEESVLEHAYA